MLPGLLLRVGLQVELHVNTKVVRAATPDWIWPDSFFREHLPQLVDQGHLTREVLDAFLADWDERSLDPDAMYFTPPFMEIVGRRG